MVKEITLTKGMVALADDSDFVWLSQFEWHAAKSERSRSYYAGRWTPQVNGKREYILMHRAIVGATAGQQVDHADGNSLNNQRHNLRFCTNAENQYNKVTPSNNTSGYKGVSLHKRSGLWRASIVHEGKRNYLGYFDTPEDAAKAYDAAAHELHSEFARTNFPNGENER